MYAGMNWKGARSSMYLLLLPLAKVKGIVENLHQTTSDAYSIKRGGDASRDSECAWWICVLQTSCPVVDDQAGTVSLDVSFYTCCLSSQEKVF